MAERAYRIISFDLDGTLVDRKFDDALWFEEIPKLYAAKHGATFEQAKAHCASEYNKVGDKSPLWYDIDYWFSHFKIGGRKGVDETTQKISHLIGVYGDAKPCLDSLKKQGFELILVSNASRYFLDQKISRTDLAKYFSKTFSVTGDLGKVKKSVEVYEQVLNEVRAQPREVLHVGDHLDFDYLVPRKLGIRSVLVDRTGESNGEYTMDVVKSLGELEGLLGQSL